MAILEKVQCSAVQLVFAKMSTHADFLQKRTTYPQEWN
jgi:hypothetical protein